MTHFRNLFFYSSLALGALAPALVTTEASACGGLFCNGATPVNQAAERIIFAKNDDGTVTAVIEIMYEGPAHEFAWVLPVPPGETEVGVSSKEALDRLNQLSNPQYRLNVTFDEACTRGGVGVPGAVTAGAPSPAESAAGGIVVVSEGNAGPYTYAQIMADPALKDPSAAAVMWLEENGYDVTQLGPELLGGYLADGMNLLAFKLQKGKNAGSVRPVMLKYNSERPLIPIKPTAVAANDDMGIKVWLLGDSRAISNNYPDLVLNESLINWFNPNSTYNDVVIAAANETEDGQGFVTEQSGPAAQFAQTLYQDFEAQQWERLRVGKFTSIQEFLQQTTRFAGYDGYNDVMLDPALVPLREGATHEQLLSCISCYFQADVPVRNQAYPPTSYPGAADPINAMNVQTYLDKFYELVIEPLEKTRALFEDHSTVTRFYTTLSPEEMTEDPEFEFNPELPDVSNVHTATQILSCNDTNDWKIELSQGMVISGQARTWPVTLDEAKIPVNLRIVQLSEEGEGEVLVDNSTAIAGLLTDLKLGVAMPELTESAKEPSPKPSMGTKDGGAARQGDAGVSASPEEDPADGGNGKDDPDSVTEGVDDAAGASSGGCNVGPAGTSRWGFLAAFGLLLPLLRGRRSRRGKTACDS